MIVIDIRIPPIYEFSISFRAALVGSSSLLLLCPFFSGLINENFDSSGSKSRVLTVTTAKITSLSFHGLRTSPIDVLFPGAAGSEAAFSLITSSIKHECQSGIEIILRLVYCYHRIGSRIIYFQRTKGLMLTFVCIPHKTCQMESFIKVTLWCR